MTRLKATLYVSAAIVTVVGATSANAQEAAPAQDPAITQKPVKAADPASPEVKTTSDDELGTIIVTAQRRPEDLQRTPVPITAVTGNELNRQVIRSAKELQGLAPGVIFIGENQMSVRGISNNSVVGGKVEADLSVSIFVDGIVNPRTAPGLLYDVSRVEILRGPQGTLYGRNNTAGALNIFNNRPSSRFEGSASIEYGNYDRISTQGMVNVPLSEQVAMRAAFMTVRHDAYQSNGYGTQDDHAGRIRLSFNPTESISILLGADYEHNGGVAPTPVHFPPGAPNPTNQPFEPWKGIPRCPNGGYIPVVGQCVGSDARTDNSTYSFFGQFDWDFGFANLTYVGGYRRVSEDYDYYGGRGGVAKILNDNLNKLMTHELRVASSADSSIKWVAGLYYYDEDVDFKLDGFPSPTAPPPCCGYLHQRSGPSSSISKAAFAQATVPVTDWFRVTGGIRYTDDRKRATQAYYDTRNLDDPVPPGTPFFDLRYDKSKVNYKIGLEADVTDSVLVFADYSTGYKAGGFNTVQAPNTVEPETIKAIQGGLKSRFFRNRVQLNIDAFYYDYTNLQIQSLGVAQVLPPPAPPQLAGIVVNAEKARYYGAEAETIIALTPDDRIQANISLLDATLTDATIGTFLGPKELDGLRAPYAPKASGRFQYRHTFRIRDGARVEAQGQIDWSAGYWAQIEHLPGSYQDSYTRTGFNVTYFSADGHWNAGIWARNLEKQATLQTFFPGAGPFRQAVNISGEPRVFGARVGVSF